ncbi:MAG TPA: hypothetical protein VGR06_40770 [Actinophytocola sp.]|uniref:hypothetical protein n=1 Tax=Actinophytocola sp. TaxID=1872138 RepID=UPI002E03C351|nr:hypothetical protein [Actinophytocola sp.]
MKVEIRGESFNYSADITADPDGEHLRTALGLFKNLGPKGVRGMLGTPQEVDSVWEAARADAERSSGS